MFSIKPCLEEIGHFSLYMNDIKFEVSCILKFIQKTAIQTSFGFICLFENLTSLVGFIVFTAWTV